MECKKKRLENRSALHIENVPMTLELWRMTDNTYTVEIELNGCRLSASADTMAELEDFLFKSHKFFKDF